uniref:Uncharacterized protein n=1 Tax=Rhizophora mucronata TaxID=61149 RepID=A0A2P2LZX0_RHIMU
MPKSLSVLKVSFNIKFSILDIDYQFCLDFSQGTFFICMNRLQST